MEATPSDKPARSQLQYRLSLVLLGLLIGVAAAVIWLQNRYDPAGWREQHGETSQPLKGRETHPVGVAPLSPTERYLTANLSDKINGKADLYLSAGFKTLESRRFALTKDKTRWMERYVYDMGGHPNAFAVYSAQKRSDGQAIGITPHTYLSSNGLFLVHGPYYLEIIASEASDEMQSQLKVLAETFVKGHSVPPGNLAEIDLFGPDHLLQGSIKLIADSAFGIQGLDWVFTADYADDPNQATAFISRRATAAQARASAEAFFAFWKEYGAEAVAVPDHLPSSRIAFILDNYEMTMVQGEYFFGVHEASSLDFGLRVMSELRQAIGEVPK